jgi:RND family efflux transporter MFP subunit
MKLLAFLAIAAGLGGGAFFYRQWQANAAALKVTAPAAVVKAEPKQQESFITATGTIRLKTGAEVRVGAQISGIVKELNASVGTHVNAGDLIATIDSRGLDARIANAKAQIQIDQSALRKVQSDLDRSRKLTDQGLAPRQQTEDLEEDLLNSQAKLAKSRSDLDVVESDLPYLEIHAPIAGTVASVSTLQGETVAASFAAPTFVTIIADNALELVAMVDETDIGSVRPREAVAFTTETYPSREFAGSVERIAPKATVIAGVVNYEVGIAIRHGMEMLKPDMTANVTIKTGRERAK